MWLQRIDEIGQIWRWAILTNKQSKLQQLDEYEDEQILTKDWSKLNQVLLRGKVLRHVIVKKSQVLTQFQRNHSIAQSRPRREKKTLKERLVVGLNLTITFLKHYQNLSVSWLEYLHGNGIVYLESLSKRLLH